MKQITFASFKGGAGKTTAAMAVTSALSQKGKRVALIDTDENMPINEWREHAIKAGTWSDNIEVYEADDLRSFERAFEDTEKQNFDYAIIDTRGGGSELNNACVINTNLVIIPSALTQLDMTQALTTFEHTIGLHQTMDLEIPTALLIQRVPVGKLTISQKQDLAALSELPCCETQLHSRDAFGSKIELKGFQLNFGCINENVPNIAYLNNQLKALADQHVLGLLDKNPVISLGGSILLPAISDIIIPSPFKGEIRIGEAIVAGTMPGVKQQGYLKPTAFFRADVIQEQFHPIPHMRRCIIGVGSTILDKIHTRKPNNITVDSFSSDICVVDIDKSLLRGSGRYVDIELCYAETERALDRANGTFNRPDTQSVAA